MKNILLIIPFILLIANVFAQVALEVEGEIKIGTTIQNNSSTDILVLDQDGVINKRDESTIPESIPSSAIVLSETADNPNLLNSNFEYIGTNKITASLVGSPGVEYGEWLNATSLVNVPVGRRNYSSIWTGTEMIVWGGLTGAGLSNSGGKYNPTSDTWAATSTSSAPNSRNRHRAVWTGTEMIVWGGYLNYSGGQLNTGGKYNPSTDSWTSISSTGAPTARFDHTMIWTGSEMIVWGGSINGGSTDTGAKYDPIADTWTAISTTNAPTARNTHSAFWTGTEMIIYGGSNNNTGSRYDPATDTWTTMSTTNAPPGSNAYAAIWTGVEMIVWGGYNLNIGAKYDPTTDTWTSMNSVNVEIRHAHTAVWTGSDMIVWGGYNSNNSPVNSGNKYNVSTDSWTALNTASAPSARIEHVGIWTGDKMLVWGGLGGGLQETGGLFDPSLPGLSPAQQIVLHQFMKL